MFKALIALKTWHEIYSELGGYAIFSGIITIAIFLIKSKQENELISKCINVVFVIFHYTKADMKTYFYNCWEKR